MCNQVRENHTSQTDPTTEGREIDLIWFFKSFPNGGISLDPSTTPLGFFNKVRDGFFSLDIEA